MLNDNWSPSSPHSKRFAINMLIHVINATSQIKLPIAEKITSRLICGCSGKVDRQKASLANQTALTHHKNGSNAKPK